jgi:ribose transport system permease protein
MSSLLRQHQKTLGIAALILPIFFLTCFYQAGSNGWDWSKVTFWSGTKISSMTRFTGLFAIIAIGAAIVIATGGVDLSMGALMGLTGVLMPMLIRPDQGVPFLDWSVDPWVAWLMIGGISLFAGWVHGMLITKLQLQPFLVTLCGLFIYRGIALTITKENTKGFGNDFTDLKSLASGQILGVPTPFVIAVVLGVIVAVLIHRTVFGRHLLALGRNEQAAKFSGINTDRVKIVAYMLCALAAGFGGVMFAFDSNSAAPSDHCQGYELYAIAGAVLGGCSLRGGECALAGVIFGTALMQVASDAVFFLDVPNSAKLSVIGAMILLGVIADEFLRRGAKRRLAQQKEV